ncbi:MAG TPA: DUF1697 domain-containing protein [Anaerolineales bacterium]|nr:DUF1697 domain-containing protein [Anaerolineales bacterium]
MAKYVALLRGINLGKRQIKMAELKKVFETQGYQDVRTLLASGNVIFTAKETKATKLRSKIGVAIKKQFGFGVPVILRSEKEVQALIKSDPFKGVKAAPQTRFYITFLSELPRSKLKTPYNSMGGEYLMLAITKGHVVSVLGPKVKSPDVMDFLGEEFGSNITTRNWNTVKKIHAAMQDL